MRLPRLLFIVIIVFGTVTAAYSKEMNVDILLRSIANVESHNVSTKIGRQGERSRYQFMAQTWEMYSRVPFKEIGRLEHQPEVEKVARKHMLSIKTTLIKLKKEVTPYSIALAWNAGQNKIVFDKNHRDYAERVNNLYLDLRQ